ncbi:hypothetical protein PR001_g11043 [Phytophthora rubi]|uniref:Uncharacterized protein n=1 Tax=Phytophthora rubi TaxID=129364 RepID=A0A6A3M8E8_9STRA|nr:hypothetical protein PR002_g10876 [Phytophthora rubi]KAE9031325.1 hypothetical protein PR001_g11043 [Phytophthora rubi]
MFESVALTAAQWAFVYIQFQNIMTSSSLQVRWSSLLLAKGFINSTHMGWDNSSVRTMHSLISADSLIVFSAASGLTTLREGSVEVDANGVMSLTATSGVVAPTFNVSSHKGATDW